MSSWKITIWFCSFGSSSSSRQLWHGCVNPNEWQQSYQDQLIAKNGAKVWTLCLDRKKNILPSPDVFLSNPLKSLAITNSLFKTGFPTLNNKNGKNHESHLPGASTFRSLDPALCTAAADRDGAQSMKKTPRVAFFPSNQNTSHFGLKMHKIRQMQTHTHTERKHGQDILSPRATTLWTWDWLHISPTGWRAQKWI